jgi:hypothetical protein
MKIDPRQLKDVICKCGNQTYIEISIHKLLPVTLSQSGRNDETIARVMKICTQCGKPLQQTINEMIATETVSNLILQ